MSLPLKDGSLPRKQAFIVRRWIGSPVDPVLNPAVGEVIASVPHMGNAKAMEAVTRSEKTFRPWSRLLAKERSVLLRRWFDLIVENLHDLATILTSEQGKPLTEARGEVDYAAAFVEFSAEEVKRIYGETIPSHQAGSKIIVQRSRSASSRRLHPGISRPQ